MEEDTLRMIPHQEDTSAERINPFRCYTWAPGPWWFMVMSPKRRFPEEEQAIAQTPLNLALDMRHMLSVFFIFLSCLSVVSGLCSTCQDEQCRDNGECIIGCARGYVGSYCEERCPPKCVNNDCYIDRIKGTVTCTDGCEPGYCGIKCSYECPSGCVTCDRRGGSCNTTLCPEGHYGADCSEICNPRYEKCDRETGQCINCRRGYFGDECTRICRGCFTKEDHITDGCLSGCEQCKTEETCTPGFYGEGCEHRCSEGCQSDDDSRRACNRATGECSAGCVSGYHGLTCNYTCNTFCVDGVCKQHNGVCTSGCIHGYEQKMDLCEKLHGTEVNIKDIIDDVIIAVVVCILVVIQILLSCIVLRNRQRSKRQKFYTSEHARTMDENGRFLTQTPYSNGMIPVL